MINLEKRIILAIKPLDDEELNENFYYNQSGIKCFFVIKEIEDKLLAIKLKFLEEKDLGKFVFKIGEDNRLRYDSVVDDKIYSIPKENVLHTISKELSDDSFKRVISNICNKGTRFHTEEAKNMFLDFTSDYFNQQIKKGSVLTIIYNHNFETYYVEELYEDYFKGVKLNYDPKLGLTVNGEEKMISYRSIFQSIHYSEEYSLKVKEMINSKKLTLK